MATPLISFEYSQDNDYRHEHIYDDDNNDERYSEWEISSSEEVGLPFEDSYDSDDELCDLEICTNRDQYDQ